MYLFFSDIILFFHFILFFFITILFFIVPIGYKFEWIWVSSFKVRVIHSFLMLLITIKTFFEITCPLTYFENTLRGNLHSASFVGKLVSQLIYWDLPYMFFTAIYFVCLI